MVPLGYLAEEKTGGVGHLHNTGSMYQPHEECGKENLKEQDDLIFVTTRESGLSDLSLSLTCHVSPIFALLQYLIANDQYATYSTVRS